MSCISIYVARTSYYICNQTNYMNTFLVRSTSFNNLCTKLWWVTGYTYFFLSKQSFSSCKWVNEGLCQILQFNFSCHCVKHTCIHNNSLIFPTYLVKYVFNIKGIALNEWTFPSHYSPEVPNILTHLISISTLRGAGTENGLSPMTERLNMQQVCWIQSSSLEASEQYMYKII